MEREGRPKREIVTTKLVAGADFFHHLPCAARRQRVEEWERTRVKPRPQHPTTKHSTAEQTLKVVSKQLLGGFSCPNVIFKDQYCLTVHMSIETKPDL